MNSPNIHNEQATTTATLILTANKKRKAVLIQNLGASAAYLLSGQHQTSSNGIEIAAGQNYSSDHFNPQGEYYIITAAGTADLRIEETIAEKGE